MANIHLLSVNASIVQQGSIALEVHRTMNFAHNIVCLALPGNRRLRGRMLAATAKTAQPENHPTLEARALTVLQESIRLRPGNSPVRFVWLENIPQAVKAHAQPAQPENHPTLEACALTVLQESMRLSPGNSPVRFV